MNFWEKLERPIFTLAPMDGVTDTVFRQIVNSVGRPTVFFTEFVSVDGLISEAGRKKTLERLSLNKDEKPVVAQIWGSNPEHFYQAAKIVASLGFDGIDINMGCPVKDVIKTGACSALINNPEGAKEIIKATIKGAGGLPVSVKTRIGFNTIDTENWVRFLLSLPIAALTLHLRTAKEMSKVPAHWDEISKAIKIREELGVKIPIFGNGDVKSLKEAKEKCLKYKIDGVMIGRGIFENVWIFNPDVDIEKVTPKEKLALLKKHLRLYNQTYGDGKHFALMKKFVKCYINNFNGASEIRENLMSSQTLEELIDKTNNLTLS